MVNVIWSSAWEKCLFFFNLSLVNEFSLEMCERSPSPWAETLQCALALCSTWCFLEVRALRAACTGCVTRRQCSEGTAKLGNSCQEVTKFCACTIFAFFPHLSSVTRGAHHALMVILGCQNKSYFVFQMPRAAEVAMPRVLWEQCAQDAAAFLQQAAGQHCGIWGEAGEEAAAAAAAPGAQCAAPGGEAAAGPGEAWQAALCAGTTGRGSVWCPGRRAGCPQSSIRRSHIMVKKLWVFSDRSLPRLLAR